MLAELERIYTVYLGHYEQALALFYRMRDESEKFKKFLSRMGQLVSVRRGGITLFTLLTLLLVLLVYSSLHCITFLSLFRTSH